MDPILRYFPDITPHQHQQLLSLEKLQIAWNARMNLVSKGDREHLLLRHILHSLSIAKLVVLPPNTRALDVGTGGGFPGLPLAILFPQCHFTLVDSTRKKVQAVETMTKQLGVSNVEVTWSRAEALPATYHFIFSRAVAPLKTLYEWTSKKIAGGPLPPSYGFWCLKGGSLEEEVAELPVPASIHPIEKLFPEPFFRGKYIVHFPTTRSLDAPCSLCDYKSL